MTIADPKAVPTPMGMDLLSSSSWVSEADVGGNTSVGIGVEVKLGMAGMKAEVTRVVTVPREISITVVLEELGGAVARSGGLSVVSVGFGGGGGGGAELDIGSKLDGGAFVIGGGLTEVVLVVVKV